MDNVASTAEQAPCTECGRSDGSWKAARRGMHSACYQRFLKHGGDRTSTRGWSEQRRVWHYVDRSGGPDACWPWTAKVRKDGYGETKYRGAFSNAHRVIFMLEHGHLDRAMQVDHTCHDPSVCRLGARCPHRRCCNPRHLRAITPRENTLRGGGVAAVNAAKTHCDADHEFTPENTYIPPGKPNARHCVRCLRARDREHRQRTAAGIAARPRSPLDAAAVREIRRRAAAGEKGARLAREYGVQPGTVYGLLRGRSWRHVD